MTLPKRDRGQNQFPIAYEYRHLQYDPLMLQIILLIQNSGHKPKYIQAHSGVTTHTLRNWINKRTRRPNASTMRAVARTLGYTIKLEKE
jgi:hypothetical protein